MTKTKTIQDFPIEALEEEIERRKKALLSGPMIDILPARTRLAGFLTFMQTYIDDIVHCVENKEYLEEDWTHYIYEEACKLACGENFFDWYNEVTKEM